MIALSEGNVSFLLENLELTPELRQILAVGGQVDDDTADVLRDLCTDLYDEVGLDAAYNPTRLGQQLNILIDKLYLG